jgi:glycosyltransferase involved in cell wall biosynthesis
VTFTGPQYGTDKVAELAAAELFVMPSRAEGQSSALLEAMAFALPVVVSAPANSPDVSGAAAGLVAGSSPAEFAAAIEYLLRDPALAEAMGARGRTLVEQQFTWPNVGEKFAALYKRLSRKADHVPGAGNAWI